MADRCRINIPSITSPLDSAAAADHFPQVRPTKRRHLCRVLSTVGGRGQVLERRSVTVTARAPADHLAPD